MTSHLENRIQLDHRVFLGFDKGKLASRALVDKSAHKRSTLLVKPRMLR